MEATVEKTVDSASKKYQRIIVKPITGVIGAEIYGADLREDLDEETFQEIRRAFDEHLVVYFPDQDITHQQHISFSQRFGDLLKIPQLHSVEGFDEVQIIRREATDTGRVVGENWHADSTYLPNPPGAVIMRAMDVPEFGGDTAFLNMYAIYESFSPSFREAIDSLNVIHSATRIFGSAYHAQKRTFSSASARTDLDISLGDKETSHPLVCTHPRTGKKFLYVNAVYAQRIDKWTDAESRSLLDFLYNQILLRLDLSCRVRWKNNQVLIWDNRCSMHRAIPDYAGKFRFLTRTTIQGSIPQ